MSRINSVLISLFIKETGKVATYHKSGAVFHTLDYVNWLEDRAAMQGESAQKAPNTASMPCEGFFAGSSCNCKYDITCGNEPCIITRHT